jgi:hypothetical protein
LNRFFRSGSERYRTQTRRWPYCARSCFVPFWPGLRWSPSRAVWS